MRNNQRYKGRGRPSDAYDREEYYEVEHESVTTVYKDGYSFSTIFVCVLITWVITMAIFGNR